MRKNSGNTLVLGLADTILIFGFEFDRIDLTRNTLMYVNDSNKTWLMKDRSVDAYRDLDKLMEIGEMEYGLHTRSHAMYIIFNIK